MDIRNIQNQQQQQQQTSVLNLDDQGNSANLNGKILGLRRHRRHLYQGMATVGLMGIFLGFGYLSESLLNKKLEAYAQGCPNVSSIQNFLSKVTFADDQLTRYAAAVNAIENKRLEIFRTAKSNPSWGSIAELAESQQTKVCDLANQPDFLRSLCNDLRSYSEDAICTHGFTNREFNQITRDQMQNADLRRRIQSRQQQLLNR